MHVRAESNPLTLALCHRAAGRGRAVVRGVLKMLPPLALVCSAMLGGCATCGREFDPARVNDIVIGKTTWSEIQTWFRRPMKERTITRTTGDEVFERCYFYGHEVVAGPSYRALFVHFDSADVVIGAAYYCSDGQQIEPDQARDAGLASGSRQSVEQALGAPMTKMSLTGQHDGCVLRYAYLREPLDLTDAGALTGKSWMADFDADGNVLRTGPVELRYPEFLVDRLGAVAGGVGIIVQVAPQVAARL